MDIPRKSAARRRRIRRALYAITFVAVISLVTVGLSRLQPAAPGVDRGTVWFGKVERGSMTRQVRGSGTLVPEEIRWIPADTSGRVEEIRVRPGAVVAPHTILMELSNPQLDQELLDAESQLKRAEAEFVNLRVQLESEYMNRQAEAARVESEYIRAKLQAEADEQLARDGLVSELNAKISVALAQSLTTRHDMEKRRLDIYSRSVDAQISAKEAEVEQRRVLHRLRQQQVDSLRVRAGIAGVLQRVEVQVGQQVAPGTNLARVAEPTRLKAEVRVPATQARDIQLGQKALVDTRNGVVPGIVFRIDPAVQEGLVAVDVQLTGELPRGARPDLNVDGTIELEHLEEILYMPRPVFGQEDASVGLFRVEADGVHAVRVPVKLGRSSVNQIEVVEGLQVGDQIILSDMSQWDAFDRVRLN